jgi:hypothetical protein
MAFLKAMLEPKHRALSDKIQKARDCARSSCRVYASNLSRIHREFLPKTTWSHNMKWLHENSTPLLAKLKKIENLHTQRNLLAAALVGLDISNGAKKKETFIKQISVLNEKFRENAKKGEMSEKQLSKFVNWKSIVKLRRLLTRTVNLGKYYTRKKLSTREFVTMQQNLALHLYTVLPPVRNDWSDVRFLSEAEWEALPKDEKKSSNNLVMARGGYRMYWARYKTVKKHGVMMQVIPKGLQRLLKKHIKFLKLHFPDNEYLILSRSGEPLSRNGLTKFLQRLFFKHFRKKISTSALRSIFLTHRFDKKALEEQREVAKAMHHTPEVARDFYVKNK